MQPFAKLTLTLLVILLTAALVLPAAAENRYGKQKVAYHFNGNDLNIIMGGLRNIQNQINAVGKENLTVVAVVHAKAWVMIKKGKASEDLVKMANELIAQGVEFRSCNNTMKKQKMTEKDLAYACEVVPCGVCELTMLQQQGYAYIKP